MHICILNIIILNSLACTCTCQCCELQHVVAEKLFLYTIMLNHRSMPQVLLHTIKHPIIICLVRDALSSTFPTLFELVQKMVAMVAYFIHTIINAELGKVSGVVLLL